MSRVDWMGPARFAADGFAVAEHLVGSATPRQSHRGRHAARGTLAYDRRRLIDSSAAPPARRWRAHDQTRAAELAASARQAVVNAGLAGSGPVWASSSPVVAHAAFLDFTGIFRRVAATALGLLVLPARKRKTRRSSKEKLTDLRTPRHQSEQ